MPLLSWTAADHAAHGRCHVRTPPPAGQQTLAVSAPQKCTCHFQLLKTPPVGLSFSKAHLLFPAPQTSPCRAQLLKPAPVVPSSSNQPLLFPAPQTSPCWSQKTHMSFSLVRRSTHSRSILDVFEHAYGACRKHATLINMNVSRFGCLPSVNAPRSPLRSSEKSAINGGTCC